MSFIIFLIVFTTVNRKDFYKKGLILSILLFLGFHHQIDIHIYTAFYNTIICDRHERWKEQKILDWIFSGNYDLLISFYALLYYVYIGNVGYRFFVLESNQVEEAINISFENIIKRLTYKPVLFFISNFMMIGILFSIPFKISIREENVKKEISHWLLAFGSILLMFWFFPVTLRAYVPMPLMGRMILMIVPIVSVLAFYTLKDMNEENVKN